MTFLRHSPRHVHQTVGKLVESHLNTLGWTVDDGTPFGATPIEVIMTKPFVGNVLDSKIKDATVAITLGSEFSPEEQELGGPLTQQEFPIFCDVFYGDESIALALASDVRDLFFGRFAGGRRSIPVIDQTTNLPAPGWVISFEDIERIAPEHTFPLSWQSIHVTAVASFNEEVW